MTMLRRVPSCLVLLAVLAVIGCPSPSTVPNGNDNGGGTLDVCDQPGTICTVAGTGMSLFDGDGKPALETSLYYPFDVVFDQQERALILDWNNLRVRRINDDGTIETIMGTDFEALPVEGALAIETSLHHASDIEWDSQYRLYVAGDHVPVVFRVGTDNVVEVIAGSGEYGNDGDGGPATEAGITTPFGVVPSPEGGFYFTDSDAHVVRFVNADGIISTVAGTGTRGYSGDGIPGSEAQLDGPTRLKLDAEGNLFFCDTRNHVVRRLDTDGILTTIAGTGELGYSGDGGPATQARFNQPYDLTFGPDGNLYVADTGNNVIRRIDGEGIVTTVVGLTEGGYAGDEGPADSCAMDRPSGVNVGPDGSLWICDTFNNRVRRVAGFFEQ